MDYAVFEDWFLQDFIKRNGGIYPSNLKKWLERLDASHEGIRTRLGGDRVDLAIAAQATRMAAPGPEYESLVDELLHHFPHYLSDNGLERSAFASPTIPRGSHNSIKISKHFLSYANARLQGMSAASARAVLERINKCISKLGAAWGKSSNSEVSGTVTISTSPKGFALLGHYGPDKESCFRQGSDKTLDKYVVGQSLNTFVITISMPGAKDPTKHRNVARAIGFMSPRGDAFNTFNYYFVPGFPEGDAIALMTKAFSQFLGKEKCGLIERNFCVEPGIYVNEYARWTFTSMDQPAQPCVLMPYQNYIKVFICPQCDRKHKTDAYWETIDDMFVCNVCASEANRCEATGRPTFKRLTEAVDMHGNFILVHPDLAGGMPTCSMCEHRFYPHDYMKSMDGRDNICASCFGDDACVCEDCGKVVGCDESDENWHIVLCDECKMASQGLQE